MANQEVAGSSWTLRLAAWANRIALSRRLAIGLTLAAIGSGVATYIKLTGSPVGPHQDTIVALIVLDLALLLPLAALILFRIVRLWTARRKRSAGSRLHLRLVLLFSLLTVTPAIVVAVFSAFFFDMGIQAWFSDRVGTALRESLTITEKYVAEHIVNLRRDIRALSSDINRNALQLMANPNRLPGYVVSRAQERGIDHVAVFDRRGRVLVSTMIDFGLQATEADDLRAAMERIDKDGEVVVLARSSETNVRAITRLTLFFDSDIYLFVRRPIENALSSHIDRMRTAVNEYVRLEGQRAGFQIGFFALYALVSLLLLLTAVWLGLYFANQLVRPVSALIGAAERVRGGDLSARVSEIGPDDEIASLSRSFNRMTDELQRSQTELVEANRQLDARREFTETVLSGVSAGVIGLDAEGRINLTNRSASQLLPMDLDAHTGDPLAEVVPEFAELVEEARGDPGRSFRREIEINGEEGPSVLIVQIAAETLRGETVGFVVTFDDITELQQAQRKAAWADVARRIAHEIKNPLTPIQLSAERLRRKYMKEITTDREVFETCTDTIIRQVGDIGRLVNEFSSFARMPTPSMKSENLVEICRRALFLQRNAHPEIAIELDAPAEPVRVACDAQQIGQAVTNLLQNAIDSLTEESGEKPEAQARQIALRISEEEGIPRIEVSDSGRGLPKELIHRLTEPYVTTRVKGTGLGLAIVRKIMDDHGGELLLENRSEGGARITMVFRKQDRNQESNPGTAPDEAAE